jgi:hypothetical protein
MRRRRKLRQWAFVKLWLRCATARLTDEHVKNGPDTLLFGGLPPPIARNVVTVRLLPVRSLGRLQRLGNRLDRTCGPYHPTRHWLTLVYTIPPGRVAGHRKDGHE